MEWLIATKEHLRFIPSHVEQCPTHWKEKQDEKKVRDVNMAAKRSERKPGGEIAKYPLESRDSDAGQFVGEIQDCGVKGSQELASHKS